MTTDNGQRAAENRPLDLPQLPTIRDLHWLRLSPRYPWLVLFSATLSWALILLVAEVLGRWLPVWWGDEMPDLLALALSWRWLLWPLALWSLIKAQCQARWLRYRVRSEDVHFRHGLLWQQSRHLPFSRIQHVGVASGPLERWLGLRQLTFYTAGSVGADLTIPGLPADNAERLRQYIVDQAGLADGQ